MEWTEEIIAQLKDLWAEGLSTAEIGRRLSITKNAVVGKAHRLGLPPRPSPIRREGKAKPTGAEKPEKTAQPVAEVTADAQRSEPAPAAPRAPLAPSVSEQPAPAPSSPQATDTPVQEKVAPKEKAAASPKAAPKSKPVFRTISDAEPQKRRGPSCCWPIGDPGTPGFHFCGATPLPGKPYCDEHAQIAYVRLRDRRDTMA
ncbi:GcrA family cell cycle regulator [Acetobacter sp. TBRC 12305]|uniref:GcrA cell cycle regulator n=1 Tax=Acetobacter garciniae TaxID=2817435 RepID=A0A939HKV6_9PROT|nr:GcrA family cell cycle regulator [Acetobacter garciniae]MBO1324615.1 GcrA cell cycle regulator [Acetobacter garciniae]MBX0344304.1 GcrA family cell cycle regulator [Acetobacter garciniae]